MHDLWETQLQTYSVMASWCVTLASGIAVPRMTSPACFWLGQSTGIFPDEHWRTDQNSEAYTYLFPVTQPNIKLGAAVKGLCKCD